MTTTPEDIRYAIQASEEFDAYCEEWEHTDTGDAWELIHLLTKTLRDIT